MPGLEINNQIKFFSALSGTIFWQK